MVSFDYRIPDLCLYHLQYSEKEIEIVYKLAQDILIYEKMLVEASDICGEIDRYTIPRP